jgi:hypothetical protein
VGNNPIRFIDPLGLEGNDGRAGIPNIPGTSTGKVTPGQIPNIANLIKLGNTFMRSTGEYRLQDAINAELSAMQWENDYGTTVDYQVVYGTMPWRIISIDPRVGPYLAESDARSYTAKVRGLAGPGNPDYWAIQDINNRGRCSTCHCKK